MLQTITLHLPLDINDDPVSAIAEAIVGEVSERLSLTEGHKTLAVMQYRDHLEDAEQAIWDHTSKDYRLEILGDAGIYIREPESSLAEALRSAQKHIAAAEFVRRKFHSQFPPSLRDCAAMAMVAPNDN